MKQQKRYHYYQKLRVQQERKAYFNSPKLVRAKRRPYKLDPWDIEKQQHFQKSWKSKRKTQYHTDNKDRTRRQIQFDEIHQAYSAERQLERMGYLWGDMDLDWDKKRKKWILTYHGPKIGNFDYLEDGK